MGVCTSSGKGTGKRSADRRLRSAIINAYEAKFGRDNMSADLPKIKVNAIVDGGKGFKTTFRSLGNSTRGNLLIDYNRSGLSSDGKTYSAVISNRQMYDDTKEFIKKAKKKNK